MTRRRTVASLLVAGCQVAAACLAVAIPAGAATDASTHRSSHRVTAQSVTSAAAAYGSAHGFHVGVAVYDRRTGRTYTGGDATGQFASESVVKVLIATRLLVEGQMHGSTSSQAYTMITQSDDGIASSLYGRVGGDGLMAWTKQHFHVPHLGSGPIKGGWWSGTRITAAGLVRLYAKLAKDTAVSGWLLDAMRHAKHYGSDGTYQFFGLPSATKGAAIKQGWGCDFTYGCNEADFNSTGYVNHDRYAVALLARGAENSYGTGIGDVLTEMARTLLPDGQFPAPAPRITGLSTKRNGMRGGHAVTVHGTDFSRVEAVRFGSVSAHIVHVRGTHRIRVRVPARDRAGTVHVHVITATGRSHSVRAARFTYFGPPRVDHISVDAGRSAGGNVVTVRGAGFANVTGVRFGSVSAVSYEVKSRHRIRVITPEHAARTVPLVVETRYGRARTASFTFVDAPTITGLSPHSGAAAGGTHVTITGANLGAVHSVAFGTESAASFTAVSDQQIDVVAPAHEAGTVDISVTTPYGSSAVATTDRFRYLETPSDARTDPAH